MADCKETLTEIQRRLNDDLAYVEEALAALEAPTPPGTVETPLMADTLVRKIALNTHLNWRSTVWGQGAWKPFFKELGVRYTRTSIGTSGAALQDLIDIGALGIIVIGDQDYDRVEAQKYLNYLSPNAQYIHAIEGPNEANNGHPLGWSDNLRDFCAWLYGRVEADANLVPKRVVGPSIWKRITVDYKALGDMSASMDVGNLHYYTGGSKPTVTSVGDDSGSAQTLDAAIADARLICPDRPMWITETGWPVAGTGCPLGPGFVTDLAQSKYLLRMLAEGYNRNLKMMAVYTLLDDVRVPPRYHGLMTQKMEKRPAFDALKRLIALYNDPGEDFTPHDLEFSISGTGYQRLPLMQKRDGTFLLALWQDVPSYDQKTFLNIDPPLVDVTIDFGSPMKFRISTPITSDFIESSGESITVGVPDHLMVIEF